MKQHLMLGVLQIPLVERNKRFRLYQIHNLPLPLPEAKLQIKYDSKSQIFGHHHW